MQNCTNAYMQKYTYAHNLVLDMQNCTNAHNLVPETNVLIIPKKCIKFDSHKLRNNCKTQKKQNKIIEKHAETFGLDRILNQCNTDEF